MWMATSGISDNRPCVASASFLMFHRIDCKSVFKVSIEPCHWDSVFN